MKYLKIFENFDIDKYENIYLDSKEEENLDELVIGDLIFNIDKYYNINIRRYDKVRKLLNYKKLTEMSISEEIDKIKQMNNMNIILNDKIDKLRKRFPDIKI